METLNSDSYTLMGGRYRRYVHPAEDVLEYGEQYGYPWRVIAHHAPPRKFLVRLYDEHTRWDESGYPVLVGEQHTDDLDAVDAIVQRMIDRWQAKGY